MTKDVYISGIGLIKITKKRGLKRMTLSVKTGNEIKMTVPYSVSFDKAEKFIREKKDWIKKSQKKISEKEQSKTFFSPQTQFSTKFHTLNFILSENTQVSISHNEIKVYYTSENLFKQEKFQEYIRYGIIETLRSEAKHFLPKRTDYLANKFGFSYSKVSVRNAKTRWGSCSGKNNISLNIHLMRLPDRLIDYVILHELCHTIEKNHGKRFWALLDKVSGNAKGLDKELKNYSPVIF